MDENSKCVYHVHAEWLPDCVLAGFFFLRKAQLPFISLDGEGQLFTDLHLNFVLLSTLVEVVLTRIKVLIYKDFLKICVCLVIFCSSDTWQATCDKHAGRSKCRT